MSSTLDLSLMHFLSLLASVYLGKDIMMGNDVAMKIGHPCSLPSRLSHEHNMYTAITDSKGLRISYILWYSKEDIYEVIIMDHLRTSLGNLIDQFKFDHEKTFSYATQMVCMLYKPYQQNIKLLFSP